MGKEVKMIVTVRVSRVYEIDINNYEGNNPEEREQSAKEAAVNMFADEMVCFEENVNDFVSTEIIERRAQ
jgi:hypothetical protein